MSTKLSTANFIKARTVWVTNLTGRTIINGLIPFADAWSTNLHRRCHRIIEK